MGGLRRASTTSVTLGCYHLQELGIQSPLDIDNRTAETTATYTA